MIFEDGGQLKLEYNKSGEMLSPEELRSLAPGIFDVEKLSDEASAEINLTEIKRASTKENGLLEKYVIRYTDAEGLNYYLSKNTNHDMSAVYSNMKKINDRMPEKTTPRPIGHLTGEDAILYEEVPGDDGMTAFENMTEKERQDFFREIGKSARQLHSIEKEGIENKKTNNSSLLEEIMQTVNKDTFSIIQKRDQAFFDRLYAAYEKIIEEEKGYMKNSELVVNHGDLHLGNIVKDLDGKVGLMDLTDVMIAPRAKDIGGFIEQVRSMLNEQGFNDEAKIKQFQDEFKSGYGEDALPPENEIRHYRAWQLWRNAMYFAGRLNPDFTQAEKQLKDAQDLIG